MAYDKSSGGCTPITAKIKRTTQGGVVQPLLNMGAPVKMKASSPAKQTKYTPGSNKPGESMTPYSVKDGKGTIHGPKVSYDMAYKNRGKIYKDMDKAEYIKEAKRQTKSFESTGKFDAPKPRKKQKTVTVSTTRPKVTIETKKPTADVNISVKPASKVTNEKAAKKATNKTRRAARVRQKGIEALESGNTQKALRLKRREARINKRAAKQANKAIEPKVDKKELRQAKRKAIKEQKSKFKEAKKEIRGYKDY